MKWMLDRYRLRDGYVRRLRGRQLEDSGELTGDFGQVSGLPAGLYMVVVGKHFTFCLLWFSGKSSLNSYFLFAPLPTTTKYSPHRGDPIISGL